MARALLRARARAVAIHLSISATIALFLTWLIVFYWYPGPFFSSDGGWRGTTILLGVDLVLGPTLTAIIYDPRKSIGKIRFDFAVIGLIQASALAWGVYTVEAQRPVAVAWFSGAFYPVTAQVVREQGSDLGRLQSLSEERPPMVYTELPTDPAARAEVDRRRAELGFLPYAQVDLLRGLDGQMAELAAYQEQVGRLAAPRPGFARELEAFLAERGKQRDDLIWVPFNGRYRPILLAFEPDGRYVGALHTAYDGLL